MSVDARRLKASLERLKPKERITYHTGVTGTMYEGMTPDEIIGLTWFLDNAAHSGEWDFTQRCIMRSIHGIGVYEYMATKRVTPYIRKRAYETA